MKSLWIRYCLAIGAIVLVSAQLRAQVPTGKQILERSAGNYDAIKDYTVDLVADVNMERLRMPRMTATLYFKSPDKVSFESPGFAMLPREGFGLPVTMLLKRYEATLSGEERMEGTETYKLHLVAKDPAARSQQMLLWVNKDNYTVLRTQTVPYQGRSVTMEFAYERVGGAYWLPDTMRIELTVPPRDSAATEGAAPQMPGGQQLEEMRRPLRSGTLLIIYSNYRVNTGLSDERFQPKMKEQQ